MPIAPSPWEPTTVGGNADESIDRVGATFDTGLSLGRDRLGVGQHALRPEHEGVTLVSFALSYRERPTAWMMPIRAATRAASSAAHSTAAVAALEPSVPMTMT
jgi:hypothetical protein